jgi:hypothetical protein
MVKAALIAEITGANISAARTVEITNVINLAMARAFPILLVAGVVILLVDAYRIFRVKNAAPAQLKGQVPAAVL